MTDTHEANAPVHSAFKVLAALAELGEATAAAVAEHAGLGYSTTTPKLRAWEGSGQVERFRTGDGRTLWRLTDSGRAATATAGAPHPTATPEGPQATAGPVGTDEQSQASDGSPSAAVADVPPPASGGASPRSHPDQHAPVAPDPAEPTEPAELTEPNQEVEAPTVAASTPVADADQDASGEPTPADGRPDAEAADAPPDGSRPGTARRIGGSLRGAVLDILEAHPDRAYKTGELTKLIDAANAGTGAAKASAGAVANAATKLVADGKAVQTVDRPATFQLAPATGGQ
ncbi:MarR family transcriptional regulator [Micromonospora sp. NPDC050200]|uniref:MarR family transcriptional regulator n=1 Tax=Micromonospora sp. NPDC050200 TaxID=3155664 RepID=UPI003411298F